MDIDKNKIDSDAETEKSRQKTFSQICNDFLQESGIHGMNKLQISEWGWWRRLIWASAILACFTYLVIIIVGEVQTFLAYPTTTSIDVDVSNELHFPAVTICNLSPYNKSRMHLNEKLQNYYLSVAPSLFIFSNLLNWSDPYYKENGFFEPRAGDFTDFIDDTYNKSMDLSLFLQRCMFDNVMKSCDEYFKKVLTANGPCFTFNEDGVIKTPMRGGTYNLMVQTFIDQSNYFYEMSGGSGIKVLIHEPGERPNVHSEGMMVHPGTIAAISISKHNFEFLPKPYKAFKNGYCLDTKAESFKNPVKFYNYNMNLCIEQCITEILEDMAQCAISGLSDKFHLCSQYEYYNMGPIMSSIHNNKTIGKMCTDRCKLPCSYTRYESQISYAQYPSDFAASEVQRMMDDPAVTINHLRSNYILLRVYYEQLVTVTTRQVPVYNSWGQILANLGGQMGLLLGASIITVSEIFEFLAFLIVFLCKKILRGSKITEKSTVRMSQLQNKQKDHHQHI